MQFFTSRSGALYPASNIARIAPPPKRQKGDASMTVRYREVTMNDGKVIDVDEHEIDQLLDSPARMVPALPNTFVLSGVEASDKNADAVWQTPVIAWGISSEGEVKPWTVDGPDDGMSRPCPLLMPNGTVVEQGDQSYRSLVEWFDAEKAQKVAAAEAAAEAEDPRQSAFVSAPIPTSTLE